MKKFGVVCTILFFGTWLSISNAWSWSRDTHKLLSEWAAKTSSLSNENSDYLNSNLSFDLVDDKFIWNNYDLSPIDWLKEGADKEDTFPRYINHFHNPLKDARDWGEAGLNDWILIAPPYLLPLLGLSPLSSILWAHLDGAEALRENTAIAPFNDWSWATVRGYYYTALTASTEEQRQEYFAKTFRGLGHQMHLLQDKAVPDHVRNSAHVIGYKDNAKI
jgi:hypothetical protein